MSPRERVSIMADEKFKRDVYGLMKEALENPETESCQDCVFYTQGRVIEFMMSMFIEAIRKIDVSAQVMEDFVKVFYEIEESLFKEKMRGPE